jgi:hypothetical protein
MALKKFTPQNKSLILSCLAGLGVIGTGWLSARAALKAERRESKKEKILAYVPAVVCGASTLVCIGASTYISREEITVLTAACAATAQKFANYRKAVHENASAEDEARINEAFYQSEIARLEQELAEREHPTEDDDMCIFRDSYTGYPFKGRYEEVNAALEDVRKAWRDNGVLAWCDVFYLINHEDMNPYESALGGGDSSYWHHGGAGWSKALLKDLFDDQVDFDISLEPIKDKPGMYSIEYTILPEECYLEY